jgi:hypothetical protein
MSIGPEPFRRLSALAQPTATLCRPSIGVAVRYLTISSMPLFQTIFPPP